jgi:hypothetical protein
MQKVTLKSTTRIYRTFRRWQADGCIDAIFSGSVQQLHQDQLLDVSVIHGDGTTTAAKKGGDNLWYSVKRLLHELSGSNRRGHHRLCVQGSRFRAFRRRHPTGREARTGYVALPVGPALRMVVIASPEYWSRHPAPSSPDDLQQHRCIKYRMETAGSL